jgi:hypothetical protein
MSREEEDTGGRKAQEEDGCEGQLIFALLHIKCLNAIMTGLFMNINKQWNRNQHVVSALLNALIQL